MMPSLEEAARKFNMNGSGCVFQHLGVIPQSAYQPDSLSPLENAVYNNDLTSCRQLIKEGHKVSVRLKIGQMSCMEYAAMMGYAEVLTLLLDESENASVLRHYFSLDDVVEMAYMISKNKDIFFDRDGLAEANRYEAALFAAVYYDKAECVRLMLNYLGPQVICRKHSFILDNNDNQVLLTAVELAQAKGHTECYEELLKCLNRERTRQPQDNLVNQPVANQVAQPVN